MRALLAFNLCLALFARPSAGAEPPALEQTGDKLGSEPLNAPPEAEEAGVPNVAYERSPDRQGSDTGTVYGEIGGSGGLFSLNYERLLADTVAIRVGGGLLYSQPVYAVSFPVTVSVLTPLSRDIAFEMGGGATVLYPLSGSMDEFQTVLARDGPIMAVPTAVLGFRALRLTDGVTVRFAWTPLLGATGRLQGWVGVAIGEK